MRISSERRVQVFFYGSFMDREVLRQRDIAVQTLSTGMRMACGDVTINVLHPPANGPPGKENVRSLVLLCRTGAHSILLTGDLEDIGLRQLLARPAMKVDVLMAPHHGSASSSSPVLLNTLRPRWVIVQSGYRNRFGHPARVVVDRYEEKGIAWAASPRCGAATWRSDAPDRLKCERKERRRYWHHGGE